MYPLCFETKQKEKQRFDYDPASRVGSLIMSPQIFLLFLSTCQSDLEQDF